MRVFLLTLGTRGDFELFCTLGRELKRRAHHVVIGTSAFYAQAVRDAGLDWVAIGSGTQDELVAVLHSLRDEDRSKRPRALAQRWLLPQLRSAGAQISDARNATDYFISNLKLALQRGGETLPGAFVSYDPPDAVEHLDRYGSRQHAGRVLELVAMNRALVDPDQSWGDDFHFTGFWTPPDWERAALPALARFIDAGTSPAVMTMGSMATFDAQRLAQTFGKALRLARLRGVLVCGWSGLTPAQDGDDLLVIDEADYEWLFPRAGCVVHHGGVGTVAAVLRAGVPSILLPQIRSQEAFGHMLVRERIATGVLETDSLDPAALAQAMGQALNDAAVRGSAQRWRALVREDAGVGAAADLIEDHWRRLGAGSPATAL
jgi:UDP:flavonoid glycosyltransferase YjiC (YdhE family)